MISPELQTRLFRPYISSAASTPALTDRALSFSSFPGRKTLAALRCQHLLPIPPPPPSSTTRESTSHLDLGAGPVAGILTVGLTVFYILDSLGLRPGAFFAVKFPLTASKLAFFLSSFPALIPNLQLLRAPLRNCIVPLGARHVSPRRVGFLGFAAVQVDPAREPFYRPRPRAAPHRLLRARRLFHLHVGDGWLPRASSFKSKQDVKFPEESLILSPLESCVHALNLLFCPLLFHIATRSSYPPLYASTRGGALVVNQEPAPAPFYSGAIAVVVVVICLEVRVIFHSFGRCIQVPPLLNYLFVTVTMLGGAAGAGGCALGTVSDVISSQGITVLAVIVSSAGAAVVRFPAMVCGHSVGCFV